MLIRELTTAPVVSVSRRATVRQAIRVLHGAIEAEPHAFARAAATPREPTGRT